MSTIPRPNIIKVHLNDEELKLVEIKMQNTHEKSRSAFVRKMIRDGFTYYVDYSELRSVIRQLQGVSTNINQIAHKANATNSVAKEDVEELRKEMKEIWRIVQSMLSDQPLEQQ